MKIVQKALWNARLENFHPTHETNLIISMWPYPYGTCYATKSQIAILDISFAVSADGYVLIVKTPPGRAVNVRLNRPAFNGRQLSLFGIENLKAHIFTPPFGLWNLFNHLFFVNRSRKFNRSYFNNLFDFALFPILQGFFICL